MKNFNEHDLTRDAYMLHGPLARNGYDWWWHNFTGHNKETGEEKSFFVEYFIINPALAEEEPVLGQLPENQRLHRKPSYLMIKAGTWGEDARQLHRFFPMKDVEVSHGAPYHISARNARGQQVAVASDVHIAGNIRVTREDAHGHPEWMCDAGRMKWDLEVDKQIAFNVGYGASKPLRDADSFAMYWHVEGMKTAYRGSVFLDGTEYVVDPETCYGYADKNWGSDFTSPWVWLSSCDLTSRLSGKKLRNSAFDIGGGCPKVYFVPLPRELLGAFWYEGKPYEFNFSKFWTKPTTVFDCREEEDQVVWTVTQQNRTALMKTNVFCQKKDMLLVNYEAPDGQKRHNHLWNGGTGMGRIQLYEKVAGGLHLIDDMIAEHVGCEYGEYDR